ncbi:MAG: GlsB/YeaQ/YmgE family stress response membrane protein [Gemmatimonadetes bacterium]|nr:GlsB/YeaQ/YmgE family stress response membrane protein [Gemmatimonadota bacterium]
MGFIWTIVIGFVVGILAKAIVPGKEGGGFIATTLLGIGGAWFGSWLFGLFGFGRVGFVGSVIGAVLLLYLFKWFSKRNAS